MAFIHEDDHKVFRYRIFNDCDYLDNATEVFFMVYSNDYYAGKRGRKFPPTRICRLSPEPFVQFSFPEELRGTDQIYEVEICFRFPDGNTLHAKGASREDLLIPIFVP